MYTEPAHYEHAAPVWPHKDVTFNTVKSTALGFAGGSAVTYGLIKLAQGALYRHWSFRPLPHDLGTSAVLGGLIGGLSGFERLKRTQIYNHRADTLNRYIDRPEILQEILERTGPPHQDYVRTGLEKNLGTANTASFWAWLAASTLSENRKLSQFFFATSALTGLSWLTAHIAGLAAWESNDRKVMDYAERLAHERAGSIDTTASPTR